MILKNLEDLIIINTDKKEKSVSIIFLKSMIKKPNFYFYFSYENKIYGVVDVIDLSHAIHDNKEYIDINYNYDYIEEFNPLKAQSLYKKLNEDKNKGIHTIPVIKDGIIKGAYIKGTNIESIKKLYTYNDIVFDINEYANKVCYITTSNNVNNDFIDFLTQLFSKHGRIFRHTSFENFLEESFYNDEVILFETETEMQNYIFISDILSKPFYNMFYTSFSNLYKNLDNLLITAITSNYLTYFFRELNNKNINVFNVVFPQNEFFFNYDAKIKEKYLKRGMFCNPNILEPEKFYLDLYSKEYYNDIIKMRENFKQTNISGINYLRDIDSRYLKIKNGIRNTYYQNNNQISNIHMYGPCLCVGAYVEDKYTISSLFQKRLKEDRINLNVYNHGSWNNDLAYIELINNTELYSGDTVIFFKLYNWIEGIDNINMNDVLSYYNFPVEYFVDSVYHANHIVHEIYSKELYNYIVPKIKLPEKREKISSVSSPSIDVYLERYFGYIDLSKYEKIGSIVMNCNPFTIGHKYLIEKAASMVDFLIVFVVSEDLSTFSFEDRFSMVLSNTSYLSNVFVVPSGHMILSQKSFPEYFKKKVDIDIESNIRNDLNVFARNIAPRLNIKYRFVGEEMKDQVTSKYNELMKEILPQYGIELIEIPRIKNEEEIISASKVRELINSNNMDELDKYISEETKKIIFNKKTSIC